jgi:hypothetical protein
MADNIQPEDIMPLDAFLTSERTQHLASESSLRWQIFKRRENGLERAGAIVKRGGRWYVVVPRYIQFILKGTEAGAIAQ